MGGCRFKSCRRRRPINNTSKVYPPMKKPEPPKLVPDDGLKVNEKKWTKVLMAAGWTVVPNVFIERQKAFGLDPLDVNILLHIMQRWWKKDDKPHPSKKTIAQAIGVDPRTVQRRIAKMERAGFIHREQRRVTGDASLTNVYHLDGLITLAKPYAQEMTDHNEQKAAERAALRAKRGKPKLKVVPKTED